MLLINAIKLEEGFRFCDGSPIRCVARTVPGSLCTSRYVASFETGHYEVDSAIMLIFYLTHYLIFRALGAYSLKPDA